jgi:hypothetical protein
MCNMEADCIASMWSAGEAPDMKTTLNMDKSECGVLYCCVQTEAVSYLMDMHGGGGGVTIQRVSLMGLNQETEMKGIRV